MCYPVLLVCKIAPFCKVHNVDIDVACMDLQNADCVSCSVRASQPISLATLAYFCTVCDVDIDLVFMDMQCVSVFCQSA